ncbi:hypothetical protein BCR44DRAFT_1431246, partial [Catenaria anguillulae PL171]
KSHRAAQSKSTYPKMNNVTQCNSIRPTAAALLPTEIVLGVLALTRPSSQVAAVCQLTASAFLSGHQPIIHGWRRRVIFSSPLDRTCDEEIESKLQRVHQQFRSRLSMFLISRLPNTLMHSGGRSMSPDIPIQDPIINEKLIDHLFSHGGPFSRHRVGSSSADDIQRMLESDSSDNEFELILRDELHSHGWRPIPDVIQLAIFFIRSGNPRSFIKCLSKAPLLHWSALTLDNRESARQLLNDLYYEDEHRLISFPVFLVILSAFDWSAPCLDVVMQVYNLTMADLAPWVETGSLVMESVLDLMFHVSDVDRVVEVVDWFQQRGLTFAPCIPLCHSAGEWPVFLELFHKYDRPTVDAIHDVDERFALGGAIARFASELLHTNHLDRSRLLDEVDELLQFAFEKSMVRADSKGLLYAEALSYPDCDQEKRWQALVVKSITTPEEWISVLHFAIENAARRALHTGDPRVLAQLLEQLSRDYKISPVNYFSQHGANWTWTYAKPLITCLSPDAWDLVACVCQIVEWLREADDHADLPEIWFDHRIDVLGQLIDMAFKFDSAKTKERLTGLPIDQLSVIVAACARCLVVHEQRDAAQNEVHLQAPTIETRDMLLQVYKAVIQPDAGGSWREYLPRHLFRSIRGTVHRASREASRLDRVAAVSDSASCMLASRISEGDTYCGQALAFLIALNSDFVAQDMTWSSHTPLWLWHKFDPALVSDGTISDMLAILRRVPVAWWQLREWLTSLDDAAGRCGMSVEDVWRVVATVHPGW